MGTCMSKNNDNQTKHEFPAPETNDQMKNNQEQGPPPEYFRRRRLSLSQSANVADFDDNDRGLVNLAANSILTLFPNRRRFSVAGVPAHAMQKGFDNKEEKAEGATCNVAEFGVGYCCKKGLKPESPNQDDFFILEVEDWGLYGVFDGHGPYGHDISNFVQQNLPRLLVQNPYFQNDPKTALKETFIEMHSIIDHSSRSGSGRFDAIMSGTTGTVILHRQKENKLYVAHVGDSRAVIAKRVATEGKPFTVSNAKFIAKDLTVDHKPELPEECARITEMGGVVKRMIHDIPYRVFVKDRPVPGLAMSRALGDTLGHSVGVSCEPDVSEFDLVEGEDEFAVMCSDGVWEFISSHEAVQMVRDISLKNCKGDLPIDGPNSATWDVSRACSELAVTAWRRWIQEEHNVVDDITAIVIRLFHNKSNDNASNIAGQGRGSVVMGRGSVAASSYCDEGSAAFDERHPLVMQAQTRSAVPRVPVVDATGYGGGHIQHFANPDLLPASLSETGDSDDDLRRR